MTVILGLESSCDDTAAALVSDQRVILAEAVVGQNNAHQPYGGVVPEIAARAHVEILPALIGKVLGEAKMSIQEVDAIAATAGPGLIGGVMVALLAGKGLALAARKPLLAINHLEGHALSPRLADPTLCFPYLLLLVSGGHCQIVEVHAAGEYRRLATTIDDAAGEAFDKAAKLLRLPYPGGPSLERLAETGDPGLVPLPRPLVGSKEPHFSFAGLKSAVQRAVE
ncbi:MAG TPA: tRNA (adenosine(37)-N6)-threonylcarbamoyltransferase complex transferase subunit TsaD, partial [Sphingomicrobium sp.]|nr:tRNA (adenosine(37)-N6)-threonylcarbamoyltransferase complex transferase subunit TsaD [Sphingomicrobium sp.]